MKYLILLLSLAVAAPQAGASDSISDANQLDHIKSKFKRDTAGSIEKLKQLPINTDSEPDLSDGFTSLYKGDGDLSGWTVLGGHHSFEASGEVIKGTCVKGSPNAFLSTTRQDYQDFIFTVEVKWEVEGNSGVMIRAQTKPGKKEGELVVFGPQVEMEAPSSDRGWSGGIFGEKAGGWHYPLVLDAHEPARKAIVPDGWNRVTIMAQGDTVKTWINGVPAAHWTDGEYNVKGFF
ncbi:MAG: 3-keto-disaccharide hydrolase, partial [Opitutales bacterium]